MLVVLLIRGVTLPGAAQGIQFYLYPNLTRLWDPQVRSCRQGCHMALKVLELRPFPVLWGSIPAPGSTLRHPCVCVGGGAVVRGIC